MQFMAEVCSTPKSHVIESLSPLRQIFSPILNTMRRSVLRLTEKSITSAQIVQSRRYAVHLLSCASRTRDQYLYRWIPEDVVMSPWGEQII